MMTPNPIHIPSFLIGLQLFVFTMYSISTIILLLNLQIIASKRKQNIKKSLVTTDNYTETTRQNLISDCFESCYMKPRSNTLKNAMDLIVYFEEGRLKEKKILKAKKLWPCKTTKELRKLLFSFKANENCSFMLVLTNRKKSKNRS